MLPSRNSLDGSQTRSPRSTFPFKMNGRTTLIVTIVGLASVALLANMWTQSDLASGSATERSFRELEETLETRLRNQMSGELRLAVSGGTPKRFPLVRKLVSSDQKRILVTGGAGFVGSNLVDILMAQGHIVYVLDNLFTGRRKNIEHWIGHPNFAFFQQDVTEPFYIEVDEIYHLACPASPPHYQFNPIKTIKTSTQGTLNMLGLAKRTGAKLLFTSTSEVYGDPEEHPQKESYWGHVNPIGPRACYDEGKRVAETMCYSYLQEGAVDVRVARIFNTFGPRMHPEDGRVVSNFIIAALKGEPLLIYGEGKQTRSFQYVYDLVNGLIKLMNSKYTQPVNIGNPREYTIAEFAQYITKLVGSKSKIVKKEASQDDPQRRRPDITVAQRELQWAPQVDVEDGLRETIRYFKQELMLTNDVEDDQPIIWMNNPPITKDPSSPATVLSSGRTASKNSK